jgi:hypothetical protein
MRRTCVCRLSQRDHQDARASETLGLFAFLTAAGIAMAWKRNAFHLRVFGAIPSLFDSDELAGA